MKLFMSFILPLVFIVYLGCSISSAGKSGIRNSKPVNACPDLEKLWKAYQGFHKGFSDNEQLTEMVSYFEQATGVESLADKGTLGITYDRDTAFYCDYVIWAKAINCCPDPFTKDEAAYYLDARDYWVRRKDSIRIKIGSGK